MEINALGQPVGRAVPGWTPRPGRTASVLRGTSCRVERLQADRHAEELWAADQHDARGESWTYLPYGPWADFSSYRQWVEQVSGSAAARRPKHSSC